MGQRAPRHVDCGIAGSKWSATHTIVDTETAECCQHLASLHHAMCTTRRWDWEDKERQLPRVKSVPHQTARAQSPIPNPRGSSPPPSVRQRLRGSAKGGECLGALIADAIVDELESRDVARILACRQCHRD
eukprot:5805675-Prymnesium_polylepis.1